MGNIDQMFKFNNIPPKGVYGNIDQMLKINDFPNKSSLIYKTKQVRRLKIA